MRKNLNKYVNYWLPVIVWAGVIFTFSSFQTPSVTTVHLQEFIIKKSAHVVVYAILAGLIYRALKKEGVLRKLAGYYSIIISSFYGITDEFHQSFTPGREPTFRDVIFDTIGSILAIYIIWNLLPKLPKKLRKLAENLQLL